MTAFVYDTWGTDVSTASDILMDFTDGTLNRRWLHSGRVDEPLSHEQYTGDSTPGTGSVYEIYADRMGSISKVVDVATGAVVAEYSYDAFGQQTQFAGALFQYYGFTGRETDPESGLIYYRARTYDPAVGRFLQRDPLGFAAGDLNLYAYVENGPLKGRDPSGLFQDTGKNKRLTNEYMMLTAAEDTITKRAAVSIASNATKLAAGLGWTLYYFCDVYFDICADPDPKKQDTDTGTGVPTKNPIVTPPKPDDCKVHGNSKESPAYTVLYALYDPNGVFLKWGITSQNPMTKRYPGSKNKMIFVGGGTRCEMLRLERQYVEEGGGPLNFEPWSSSRGPR